MAVQKPTKQQTAQAKARAGGNNPIKVTNSGLKKLGSAALLAASLTPVGRSVKIAATVAKAAKAEGVMAKTAAAAKTAQIAKNSVKVKPAAKPVGNPVNQEKSIESMISSVSRGGLKTGGTLGKGRDHRVANSKQLKWEPNSRKVLDEIAAMKKTKTVKVNSAPKSTADSARTAALRAAKNKALANSAKGKTQTPTAEAARRRNLNK